MGEDATLRRTQVDLEGLMKVLGAHLYSTPTVAIRELVQNAHDSLRRRTLEAGPDFDARIHIRADPDSGALSIEDTGAGLTEDEIHRYLATVGSGYTRALRQRQPEAGLIGLFGLGFLSAFIVSDRTEVWTCSYQSPEKAFRFSSLTGETYRVEPAKARPVGTRVRLSLQERFRALANPELLRQLLQRYCGLLELPVLLGDERINSEVPPWRDEERSPLRRRKLALDFAARFEADFVPLCTLPLVRPPELELDGLLWIQDGATFGTSDHRNVWVYVRGMLVSQEERDLLPAWAGFAGAIVESPDLTPTASRETLQRDASFDTTARALHESLVAGLAHLAGAEPATWRRILLRHNEALLGAALCDERLFSLLADDVTVPTTQGELTLPTLLERAGGCVHVSHAERGGFEEILFRALKVPVVIGNRYGALPFCERYTKTVRGRLVHLGTGNGEDGLFQPVSVSLAQTERLNQLLGAPDTELVATRFEPEHLPFVLVADREVELKRRLESDEADKRISTAILGLARQHTKSIEDRALQRLYVNLNCRAVAALLEATPDRAERAVGLLKPLVTLLSETGPEAHYMPVDEALRGFCESLCSLLEEA